MADSAEHVSIGLDMPCSSIDTMPDEGTISQNQCRDEYIMPDQIRQNNHELVLYKGYLTEY